MRFSKSAYLEGRVRGVWLMWGFFFWFFGGKDLGGRKGGLGCLLGSYKKELGIFELTCLVVCSIKDLAYPLPLDPGFVPM